MKITKNTRPNGSVLLISLVLVTIILLALASYLTLVSNESQAVSRSQNWNACLPVMEAGVEEAMCQIHQNGITNLSANSWTLGADGLYHKTRTISSDGSWYTTDIQPVSPPVIYATAHVPAPFSATSYVVRKVRVNTTQAGPQGGGLVAKGNITFKGSSIFDSYNSSVGYTPGVHGTNAVAISNTNTAGAVTLSGGTIYGEAMTGAGGTVATSGGGTVGNTLWTSSHSGAAPGATADDANVQIDDVAVPYTTGLTMSGGKYQGTNYTYLLNGNLNSPYYFNGNLTMNSSQTILVQGNVTLYVTGSIQLTGSAGIIIAPGASLKLYVGGACSLGGHGVFNQTSKPASFAIYGLPTCTSISYGGTSTFYGIVYAPEANYTFVGNTDCYGSFTANTITIGGGANVHYDEALGASGAILMASWNEIQPN